MTVIKRPKNTFMADQMKWKVWYGGCPVHYHFATFVTINIALAERDNFLGGAIADMYMYVLSGLWPFK